MSGERLNGLIQFDPIYKQVVWGGERIAALKGIHPPFSNLGESWEISAIEGRESVVASGPFKGLSISELTRQFGTQLTGTEVDPKQPFPLLVKFIDAHADLSLQVHPTDDIARRRHSVPGKAEMWYVLEATEGAAIYNGLLPHVSRDLFIDSLKGNSVMQTVATYKSAPGQFYFLPPGTVHAIGAGNVVVEVQQTSDVTYRVYDYDRRDVNGLLRPLHIDSALESIEFNRPTPPQPAGCVCQGSQAGVVDCPHFKVDYIEVSGPFFRDVNHSTRSFSILICLDGDITVHWKGGEAKVPKGNTVLVPAVLADVTVSGEGKLLAVRV